MLVSGCAQAMETGDDLTKNLSAYTTALASLNSTFRSGTTEIEAGKGKKEKDLSKDDAKKKAIDAWDMRISAADSLATLLQLYEEISGVDILPQEKLPRVWAFNRAVQRLLDFNVGFAKFDYLSAILKKNSNAIDMAKKIAETYATALTIDGQPNKKFIDQLNSYFRTYFKSDETYESALAKAKGSGKGGAGGGEKDITVQMWFAQALGDGENDVLKTAKQMQAHMSSFPSGKDFNEAKALFKTQFSQDYDDFVKNALPANLKTILTYFSPGKNYDRYRQGIDAYELARDTQGTDKSLLAAAVNQEISKAIPGITIDNLIKLKEALAEDATAGTRSAGSSALAKYLINTLKINRPDNALVLLIGNASAVKNFFTSEPLLDYIAVNALKNKAFESADDAYSSLLTAYKTIDAVPQGVQDVFTTTYGQTLEEKGLLVAMDLFVKDNWDAIKKDIEVITKDNKNPLLLFDSLSKLLEHHFTFKTSLNNIELLGMLIGQKEVKKACEAVPTIGYGLTDHYEMYKHIKDRNTYAANATQSSVIERVDKYMQDKGYMAEGFKNAVHEYIRQYGGFVKEDLD